MISVNGEKLELGKFPDGTLLMKFDDWRMFQRIRWQYESDEELFALVCLVKHMRRIIPKVMIDLDLFYVPHARMDRVKNYEDVFTLKYFADIINSLFLHKVRVLDVHSHVAEALIDRLEIIQPTDYIKKAIEKANDNFGILPMLCFPDEGSMKRYSGMFELPYVFGIKERDWRTGDIKKLSLVGETSEIIDRNVLIVDDICSKGGTFYHTAKALQEYEPASISLYVTHCENSILDGELINSGLLKKIYTTDSIFTKEHPLIEVIKL